jgi:hypothetical protein
MKKALLPFCFLLALAWIPATALSAKPVKIEILFMNHGPLQPTLKDLRTLFTQYGKKISVSWHDVDTDDGEAFMAKKGIRQHIPLVIWMDDKVKFQLDGKDIIFAGFPTGAGPLFFQGKWTMADLQKILDQVTGKK